MNFLSKRDQFVVTPAMVKLIDLLCELRLHNVKSVDSLLKLDNFDVKVCTGVKDAKTVVVTEVDDAVHNENTGHCIMFKLYLLYVQIFALLSNFRKK